MDARGSGAVGPDRDGCHPAAGRFSQCQASLDGSIAAGFILAADRDAYLAEAGDVASAFSGRCPFGRQSRVVAGYGAGPALGVEKADFGDLADRSGQHGVPVELIAPAVPAEAAHRQPVGAQPVDRGDELVEPLGPVGDVESQVGGLGDPERALVAGVPGGGFLFVGRDALVDGERVGAFAVDGDAHRVEVVTGHDPLGGAGEGLDAGQDGRVDAIDVGDLRTGRHAEVQVPHASCSRARAPSAAGSSSGVTAMWQPKPSAPIHHAGPIGVDPGQGLEVGQRHVGQGGQVVGTRGAAVVPEPERAPSTSP